MQAFERRLATADSIVRCNIQTLSPQTRVLQIRYRTTICYTEADKPLMRDRWRKVVFAATLSALRR
jgi:hypothetical protein